MWNPLFHQNIDWTLSISYRATTWFFLLIDFKVKFPWKWELNIEHMIFRGEDDFLVYSQIYYVELSVRVATSTALHCSISSPNKFQEIEAHIVLTLFFFFFWLIKANPPEIWPVCALPTRGSKLITLPTWGAFR